MELFQYFHSLGGSVNFLGGYLLVCHVVIWYIWKAWNDEIFNRVTKSAKEVEKSFFLAWNWFWIIRGRSFAASYNGIRILSTTCTYSGSSVCPAWECGGSPYVPLELGPDMLMVDLVGLRSSMCLERWFWNIFGLSSSYPFFFVVFVFPVYFISFLF